ncbi:restriction endonuclease subunit S [Roseateles sp.]|uniref:restriction endonuclease subunit S n=1 Tax=Roseateles sp. TaxID=1971397 RepID=UPI00393C42FC
MKLQPQGWTTARLAELVEILDARRVPVNADERAARVAGKSADELIPYYGATGQVGWIDQPLFDEELLLLGEDGVPFHDLFKRKAYRVTGKSWVNNHAHVLRAIRDRVDCRYLEHFLNRFDYVGAVTGSTRLKLTQAAMAQIPVAVAPRAEQHRIADKLDSVLAQVDACRARLARVAPLLKRFRQSVLAAATSGRLTEDWRQGGEYQTTRERFSDVVSESLVGLVRSSSEQSDLAPGLVPYLKMNSIAEDWGYKLDGLVGVRCTPEEVARYSLQPGDWLFNTRNSIELVGKSCVWRTGPVVFNNNILRVRFQPRALPDFVEVWFRSPAGRAALASIKSATTSVAAVYQKSLFAVQLELPAVDEQAQIVRRVETLFAFADRLEFRLTQAQTAVDRLTPSLLAKAFRGELVPQDPADEPAAELLRRLAAERNATPARPRRERTTA